MYSYTYDSYKEGYRILILGAVHGNEVCGTNAINILQEKIQENTALLQQGSLTLVPICNPKAYKEKKRYIDNDLGRIFMSPGSSYEHTLVPDLQTLLENHDIILDLHSMRSNGKPFIFIDYPSDLATQVISYSNIDSVITGRPSLYPENDQGDLHKYAYLKSKVSICIECGSHTDPNANTVAYKTVTSILGGLGSISSNQTPLPKENKVIAMQSLFLKEKSGRFTKDRNHGDCIRPQQIIAKYDDGTILRSPYQHETIMILPKLPDIGGERFYLGSI